ncbi:hypothetical protein [Propionivibrio soli]|jgi:hypothetical protein|uniref:hypothetical protein n=1 Tax=Propionivibrio soli TaxID=2976531 RepID=UPI0021E90D6D|nr:hypothetical protein [Propionivibrio soli]
MAIRSHDCRCIALTQLETALRLYFEGSDFFSVITLAGNADEIFGKIVKAKRRESSLDELKKAVAAMYLHLYGEELSQNAVAERANWARNAIKHGIGETPTVAFDAEEEAKDMLNRAIQNYWVLESWLTPAMEKFQRESVTRVQHIG